MKHFRFLILTVLAVFLTATAVMSAPPSDDTGLQREAAEADAAAASTEQAAEETPEAPAWVEIASAPVVETERENLSSELPKLDLEVPVPAGLCYRVCALQCGSFGGFPVGGGLCLCC